MLHGPAARYDNRRVELDERLEGEDPFVQARMGKREPGLVERDALDQQQVEVHGARAVPWPLARPAELTLDLEQRGEQLLRLEQRLDCGCRIEKERLVEVPDRVRLPEGRDRHDLDLRLLAEKLERAGKRGSPVAQIRSEPHVGTPHNPTLNTIAIQSGAEHVQLITMRLLPLPYLALAALVGGIVASPASAGTSSLDSTLVELHASARCTDATLVVEAGGAVVAPSLGLYLVPNETAARLVPALRKRGSLRLSAPNRIAGSLAVQDFADPLVPTEWWRSAIGVDTLTPPGPGRPVTIVDSGLDVTHPEFLGRANTETLNDQEPAGVGGEHGTAVGSVVAAPANGLGLVGVYPEAVLRSWDAAKGAGTKLETYQIVQGILAAANSGPGVINLSLGGDQKEGPIEQAIYEAVRKGTLVVASSGNSGSDGNPLGYPASIPHVLTVGATDASNEVASFSSRSRFVDLSAPGVAIPMATAIGKGWTTGDGTSFSAPLVSGAAAWVWTVRPDLDASQLFEVMRRSAVDIGAPGRDDAAGFGLLNVPAALGFPAPVRDPLEPNDDVEFVKVSGFSDTSVPPLTTPGRRTTAIRARIDAVEDPRDVYRVWLPRNGRFTAALTADTNLDLGLWKQTAISVTQRIAGSDRLARAVKPGSTELLTFTNKGPGRFAFLSVVPTKGVREATYRLRVS